jgi:dolichol kinase
MMRTDELPGGGTGVTFNGATCVMVGAFLMALLFPIRLAAPLLAMTMLADAAAALVGRRWGRHAWGPLSATVEGSTAFIATGLVVVWAVPNLALAPAALAVFTAAVVEALPIPVNDNIRVPLSAGVVMIAAEAIWKIPPPPAKPVSHERPPVPSVPSVSVLP